MTRKRAWVHCGSWGESRGSWSLCSHRAHSEQEVSPSVRPAWCLPGLREWYACALPAGKAATGPFQDPSLQEWELSSNILLLIWHMWCQLRVIASVLPLNFCLSPKRGFSLRAVSFNLPAPNSK